jgi:DNA-binding transcriptional ArsR family regulator
MNGMADLPTPERVTRFLDACAAPTRVTVLHVLMQGPMTYGELFEKIGSDVMSQSAVYGALHDLQVRGYVEDDAPDDVVRRLKRTLFWANKQVISEDLGATVAYFLV